MATLSFSCGTPRVNLLKYMQGETSLHAKNTEQDEMAYCSLVELPGNIAINENIATMRIQHLSMCQRPSSADRDFTSGVSHGSSFGYKPVAAESSESSESSGSSDCEEICTPTGQECHLKHATNCWHMLNCLDFVKASLQS